jgi:acetylornithine deacetylase/succinyl-diaminopimelate desuccinylase-like protein
VEGGHIAGLGASNPKGPAVCELVAAAAVARAGVPLKGSVLVGHVAGGSQKAQIAGAVRRYYGPRYQGQGVGCEHMLRQGVRADFAISAKPGYAVSWEEAGDCWFRVQVHGVVGDVTSRHAEAYKHPIVEAAEVIKELEAWFPEYTAQNTAGQIAPQATIGAVEAGWPFKPTFIPAICNLYLSMRTNPRVDLMSVQRQLDAALDAIRTRHPDLDLQCEMYLAVPGQVTDPDNWIVRSCIRGWEAVEGQTHQSRSGLSYAPDSNVLRQWGIPTARLGLDRAKLTAGPRRPWLDATEVVSIEDLLRLTRCYVYAIVDTCTRSLADTGIRQGGATIDEAAYGGESSSLPISGHSGNER